MRGQNLAHWVEWVVSGGGVGKNLAQCLRGGAGVVEESSSLGTMVV